MKFPKLSKTLAVLIIIAAVAYSWALAGSVIACFAVYHLLAMRRFSARACAFDNTVDSELELARLLDIALEGFVSTLLAFRAFSLGVTGGKTLNAVGARDVLVPYLPAETSASKDFDAAAGDCYEPGTTNIEKRKVTIDKRKYQPWTLTSEQSAVTPILNSVDFARFKGQKLAEDVLADVLSLITVGNFPNYKNIGSASNFDTDDVFDIRLEMNDLKMPRVGRQLILDDDYDTALLKDNKDNNEYGSTDPRWNARIPRIAGMDEYGVQVLPTTGNLVGIANFPSAILVANAPLEPLPKIKQALSAFEIMTHEETGLSFVYKEIVDPRCDELIKLIECTYGYGKGEEDALLRLTSA